MKKIAEGYTADVYDYTCSLVLKLFKKDYPKELIEHEYKNSSLVGKLGIKNAMACKIVDIKDKDPELKDRDGIIFEKINGRPIREEIDFDDQDSIDFWMLKFASLHKSFHNKSATVAMNYKDFLKLFAQDATTLFMIDELPNGDSLLHGDFNLDNVLVSSTGEFYAIDMMNVCRGPANYDIARTYFLLSENKAVAETYLSMMNVPYQSIMPYLLVLERIRDKELSFNH